MTLLVPNVGEILALQLFLNQILTLKLYSNNKTPAEADTAASYTVVAGGGYASKTLTYATWGITAGAPSVALYGVAQNFEFTGATTAPGTVYGYYVVNADNVLMWAERFPEDILPFTPANGSLVRIYPRFEAS